ncbi:hypothetical protein WHR41_09352 [Cladosporium halotolerans]|uniref:DUF1989 domain-containing protein n=1 Tax=Cladosporium halotolerans TaxID=1052096 RepID=A0AB34KDV5_9PEZI
MSDPAKPLRPKPQPAYQSRPGSILYADRTLYSRIATATRTTPKTSFILPPRSGRAWHAPARTIIRISTPEGPQVGDLNIWSAHNPRERFWAARTRQLHASHVTGLDEEGRYFMEASPAKQRDFIEFFAEQGLLMALSTCPGGDLSQWGGCEGEGEGGMKECCRPLKVEVFELEDEEGVLKGWEEPKVPKYEGRHGLGVPVGEGQ